MPQKPIDYSKTVFYKLVCKDITITDLYVGQTTDIKARKHHHKHSCNCENNKNYNNPVYKFIRENGGFTNWDMIVIDSQSCIDSQEAHTIERHYVEILFATLNTNIPSRTYTEWRETNKDIIKEKRALFYEENKDRIREEHAIFYQENRERIRKEQAIFYQENRERIRGEQSIYTQANKSNKRAYDLLYKEANKDKIRELKKLQYQKKKLLKQEQPLAELTNHFV